MSHGEQPQLDAELRATFVEEARGYLAVLGDERATAESLRNSRHGLRGAALMVGLVEIAERAASLAIGEPSAVRADKLAAIEALLVALEADGTPPVETLASSETSSVGGGGAGAAAADAEAWADGWDPETTKMLRELFAQEASEHLEVMVAGAINISASAGMPGGDGGLREILRRAHTLKGSAATVGLGSVEQAAHLLEERCVEIDRAGLARDGRVTEPLLAAFDVLRTLVERATSGEDVREVADQLNARLAVLAPSAIRERRESPSPTRSPTTGSSPVLPGAKPSSAEHVVVAGAERRDETSGSFFAVGGAERRDDAEARDASAAAAEDERRRGLDRRRDSTQLIRVDVERIEELMNAVGQLVIDRTRIERRVEELKGLARDLSVSRRALHGSALDLDGERRDLARARITEVDVELADSVSNLERATAALMEDSEVLRRTTRVLEEHLTRVRMMPIRWLYARLQRPVREMARSEGKRIELHTEGESAEMDRSVVEKITDPLIHLIRNAVAHGIESPEQRRAVGKDEVGTIRVTARHQGDMLFLEVEDDGAGVNLEAVRAAAKRLGVRVDERVSDEDLLDVIFSSGFSTRKEATGLAGRGVGLDIVRHNIASLGGDIRVTSRAGVGTRFAVRLPMTTAIAQALLFKVGDQVYAIPVAHVISTASVPFSAVEQLGGGLARVRLGAQAGGGGGGGETIPLLMLHEVLGCDPALPGEQTRARWLRLPVVLVAFGNKRFAVSCRRLIGPREIVLKRLGPLLGRIPLFAAATVSGSGKVQFVLDIAVLAELAQRSAGEVADKTRLAPAAAAATAAPIAVDRMNTHDFRVLLADDSRSIREAVGLILRSEGYAVDAAADGWDAWERLQRRRYDILVTDLEMPRVHGYELIAKCRRDPDLEQLPIVVLTSRTADRNRHAALRRGADEFIAKPINRRLILETIALLLRRRPDARVRTG